jgi:hypothetical protein
MKKVLYLSLVTCSIFSMKLDNIRSNCLKAKTIQQKLVKRHLSKLNEGKEHSQKSNDDIKQCIDSSSFFASKGLGKIKLYHDAQGFHVRHNDKMHYVQPCFTDSIVRNVTPQQMKDFQKAANGYLYINQMGDGQFSLEVKDRTRGGGPHFGAFMYWVTKSLCYGTIIAAAGTIAVTAGAPVVGAITGKAAIAGGVAAGAKTSVALGVASHTVAASGAIAATELAAATTAATLTSGAVGSGVSAAGVATAVKVASTAVSVGTGLSAAAITGAGLAGEAVTVTGAAVSTGATTGGIVAGIEALSISVGLLFGMLPTP